MSDILKLLKKHTHAMAKAFNLESGSVSLWYRTNNVPRKLYWPQICKITGIAIEELTELFEHRIAQRKQAKEAREERRFKQQRERPFIDYFAEEMSREVICEEVERFKQRGGKITVLSAQPSSSVLLEEEDIFDVLIAD